MATFGVVADAATSKRSMTVVAVLHAAVDASRGMGVKQN
jgi:hypothetical protein